MSEFITMTNPNFTISVMSSANQMHQLSLRCPHHDLTVWGDFR